jgi:hypothetical protein
MLKERKLRKVETEKWKLEPDENAQGIPNLLQDSQR